jgi:hypothetical protein
MKPVIAALMEQIDGTAGLEKNSGVGGIKKGEDQQKASQGMKKGGKVKVSSASKRADGIAVKGKTRGRMI